MHSKKIFLGISEFLLWEDNWISHSYDYDNDYSYDYDNDYSYDYDNDYSYDYDNDYSYDYDPATTNDYNYLLLIIKIITSK